jgi:hypothetical protein
MKSITRGRSLLCTVSVRLLKGARNTDLKAERGGGGVDERPHAMIAGGIVRQLLRKDWLRKENDGF